MSLLDRTSDGTGSGRPARDEHDTTAPPHQGAWFGLSDHDRADAEGPFAGVVFNRPIDQVLTYRVPRRLRADHPDRGSGCACRWVGATTRRLATACGSTPQPPGDLDPARIKDVVEVLDPLPLIDDKMLDLTRWMADYYACSWGQALDAVVPAGVKKHAGTRIGTFLIVPEEIRADLQDEIAQDAGCRPSRPRCSRSSAGAMNR